MNGLELCERYFIEVGLPMLAATFPSHVDRIAAGLVGEGSECLGFDDELSRDHDWGPSFCLWLSRDDHLEIGPALRDEINRLPRDFEGTPARSESAWGSGRTGVFEVGSFYRRFIGLDHPPTSLREWRAIPEGNLAVATSGKIFRDPSGEFTDFRERLLAFYPEDIRLKKIAARCMSMAQAGQYNYPRCIHRGEAVAAEYAKSQFAADAISMVFLLNRCYRPFYKWMHRALKGLPLLGDVTHELCTRLFATSGQGVEKLDSGTGCDLIEQICHCVIGQLRRERLSSSHSDFLLDHGPQVLLRVEDPDLRSSNVWVDQTSG
ncbi:MAG: DUF4037 domain-containing protein [Desulfuromonadales bacterium]|nr:DUF4037 domain-containing protein [Desulfuromonadales bacterium]